MTSQIPLLLFAKAPIAGRVKTRLQTHCTGQQAADIAQILMDVSLRKATQYWPGPVYLSVWLDKDHWYFEKMTSQYRVSITQQCAGDLGAKMKHALEKFGYPAAVMGCDVPHISSTTLQAANRALSAGRSVIGASEDGGYYLLGLTQSAEDLFSDISWGSSEVFEKTIVRAQASSLDFEQLPMMMDIDEWSDLQAARTNVPELNEYLESLESQESKNN